MDQEVRSCEQIKELLPDFSVGAVDVKTHGLVGQHVRACTECASELAALERTNELIAAVPMEPAPDLWIAIQAYLTPRAERSSGGIRAWLGRYRLQSAVAFAAAAAAMAAWLFVMPQQTPEPGAELYLTHHASMSWNEPFADKAGLGLTYTANVEEAR